jgi:hypothetical protein
LINLGLERAPHHNSNLGISRDSFLIGLAVLAPYTTPWNILLVVHALQNAPQEQYSKLIEESSEKSSTAQTASMHQQDSFKEPSVESREKEVNFEGAEKEVDQFSRTLPEVVPIRWTKNNSLPTHAARVGVQNTTFHPSPGIYEIDTSITTSASDAEARSLATALEPKKRMFSVKGLRRNILQQNLENSDQVASGFSLQTLAQVLEDAAAAGNLPLVASTLDLGADVNYSSRKNKECHLALHRAAEVKHEPVVEYLLRMGANRDTAASALYAAINHKATGIAMKLVPRADFNKMWKSTRLKGLPHNVYESSVAALVGMDEESRRKILRLMMEQPSFDAESPAMSFVENIDELSSPKSSGMTVLVRKAIRIRRPSDFRIRFSTFDVRLVARAHPTKNCKHPHTTPIYHAPSPCASIITSNISSLYKYKGKRGGKGRARGPY